MTQTQLSAIKLASKKTFIDELILTIEDIFPTRCDELGKDKTNELIESAVSQAETKGLVTKASVGKYVVLSFVYGQGFEFAHRYSWKNLLSCEQVTDADVSLAYDMTMDS